MNVARSSLKLFSSNVANAGIQFLGIAYFARELGATQLGIFFLFQVVLGVLMIPADFGIRNAVQKRISEGKSRQKYLSSAIVLKLVPISVIILGILILQPYIDSYVGAAVTVLLAVALLLQEVSQLSIATLNGELRVGETAILKVTKNVIWVVTGSILIQSGLGAEALIYGLLAGMGFITLWGWHKVSVSPGMPSRYHTRSLFEYSKYSVVSSIGGYLYSWTDVAVIGLFLTQAHVGAYEIAWRVSAMSILFSRALASTIFPQVSEWETKDAHEQIEKLITRTISPSLFLVIPAFFGTTLLSGEILTFVFGEEYAIAALVLVLLMGEKIFQAVHLIIGRSLQAINKPDLAALAAIVSLSVNVVLNIIFVLRFGILGAAVATVISALLNDILHFIYLRRFITIRFPKREIIECVLASGLMAGVLYIAILIHPIQHIATLFIYIIFGMSVYATGVLLMPNLRLRVFEVLDHINFE